MKRKKDSSIPNVDSTGVATIWHGHPFTKSGGFGQKYRNGTGISPKDNRAMLEIRASEIHREKMHMMLSPTIHHDLSKLSWKMRRKLAPLHS